MENRSRDYDIVQKPHQTVHDYLTEMQFKSQRTKVTDEILLQLAVKGLRANIRSQVLQHEQLDWDTLVKWATLAESTTSGPTTAESSPELGKILDTMTQMKSSITNLEKQSRTAEVSQVMYAEPPTAFHAPYFDQSAAFLTPYYDQPTALSAPYYEPSVEMLSGSAFRPWQQQQQPCSDNPSWRQPSNNWQPPNQYNNYNNRDGYNNNNNGSNTRGGYNGSRGNYNNNVQRSNYNNTNNQRPQANNNGNRYGNQPMQRYNNYGEQQQPRNFTPRGQNYGNYRGGRGSYNNNRPYYNQATQPSQQTRNNFAALPERADQRCTHCAGPCHADMSECRAQGQVCTACGKLNHFAKACRQKARRGDNNSQ